MKTEKFINIRVEGEGEAILLLHGFMENQSMWDPFVAPLSAHFKVITLDLPGHGKSASYYQVHDMDFMAEVVKDVLDRLEIEQLVLVGHSMGGYVSLAFANNYPTYVKGVCLFHSHAMGDAPDEAKRRDRTVAIVQEHKTSFITSFIPNLFAEERVEEFSEQITVLQNSALQMPTEGITAALLGMKARKSMLGLLTKAPFPFLFIGGKGDQRIPIEKMLAQVSLPHHAELLLLGNVGHMGFIEAEKETLSALSSFAQRCYQNNI